MRVIDILDQRQLKILDELHNQLKHPPTSGEIVWKSLQYYFARLAGRL